MYQVIAGLLLYFLLLRKLDSSRINPVKAAAIFVLGTFILLAVVTMLENIASGTSPLAGIVTVYNVITSVAQFLVAVGIFYKAEEAGDEYLSYAFWGGLGLALIFYAVPILVQSLVYGLF